MNYLPIKLKSTILLFGFLTLSGITAFAQNTQMATQKLGTFMAIVDQAYVDTVNSEKLVEDAIESMLKDLDPHSVYISKKDLQKMNEPLEGKFEGVGIQFNLLRDTILVVSPILGGPSERVGIQSGDKIIKIDGELAAGVGFKNNDVMTRLRGDKGTKVVMSIYRRSEPELLDFEVIRDKIPIYSVDAAYMLNENTGYIKVNKFAAATVTEFQMGLDSLKNQGIENLILDLRGNSGGYLNTAIKLADEFLPEGKLIVYTEGRNANRENTYATKKGSFEKGKVAVLIDEGSASASEIVSGAIQDWDRGVVVGRRSFGKGLVQKPFQLPDGSAVRLTISRYYTPSGRCIQRPYNDGDKKEYYESDYELRVLNGEFYSADSIKIDENLKYQTGNGRVVYGGGGIIPDVFVPLDTTEGSKYYSKLIRKGIFNQFTLTYTDNNRKQILTDYPTLKSYKNNFEVTTELKEMLFAYADSKEVERNKEEIETSSRLISSVLKAYIARSIYGNEAYYVIINDIDKTIEEAVNALNDDTFKKLKLSYK